jgi:LacI family transcriptional regulator
MFSPLQMALQGQGKDAIFFSIPFLRYPEYRLTECISSRSLEGCLIFPAFSETHPIMQEALALNLPCVNFENVVGPRCSSVISDDRLGGRMAGRKLTEKGHRVIGFLSGPPQLRICKERYEGFCEALSEAGIAHDPSLVAIGDFSGSGGAERALGLREANPAMTALFCANDLMAMGAMMAFAQSGVAVPDQVSIVGYDGDHFTPYTSPPMTTIKHSRGEVSSIAVSLLMELLEGNPGRGTSVPPELIERQSLIGLD